MRTLFKLLFLAVTVTFTRIHTHSLLVYFINALVFFHIDSKPMLFHWLTVMHHFGVPHWKTVMELPQLKKTTKKTPESCNHIC